MQADGTALLSQPLCRRQFHDLPGCGPFHGRGAQGELQQVEESAEREVHLLDRLVGGVGTDPTTNDNDHDPRGKRWYIHMHGVSKLRESARPAAHTDWRSVFWVRSSIGNHPRVLLRANHQAASSRRVKQVYQGFWDYSKGQRGDCRSGSGIRRVLHPVPRGPAAVYDPEAFLQSGLWGASFVPDFPAYNSVSDEPQLLPGSLRLLLRLQRLQEEGADDFKTSGQQFVLQCQTGQLQPTRHPSATRQSSSRQSGHEAYKERFLNTGTFHG